MYYLNRSQPPLLCEMVNSYFAARAAERDAGRDGRRGRCDSLATAVGELADAYKHGDGVADGDLATCGHGGCVDCAEC